MTVLQPTSYTEINRLYRSVVAPIKKGTLLITSTRDGEGATLIAHIVALRAAEAGSKTLLVDLNIKNSHLTKSLGLEKKVWGLSGKKFDLDEMVVKPEGEGNLCYLPAPADMESITFLKDGDNVKALFEALNKEYEKVIIDTTPIGAINRYNVDPVILASAAKRTVIVILTGMTQRKRIKMALSQLNEVGVSVEGVVLNDWQAPSLRDDVMALLSWLQGVTPGLANWLRHKVISQNFH